MPIERYLLCRAITAVPKGPMSAIQNQANIISVMRRRVGELEARLKEQDAQHTAHNDVRFAAMQLEFRAGAAEAHVVQAETALSATIQVCITTSELFFKIQLIYFRIL